MMSLFSPLLDIILISICYSINARASVWPISTASIAGSVAFCCLLPNDPIIWSNERGRISSPSSHLGRSHIEYHHCCMRCHPLLMDARTCMCMQMLYFSSTMVEMLVHVMVAHVCNSTIKPLERYVSSWSDTWSD